MLPGMSYAKCPRCLRQDLTDWEEKYYYPPRWQQALLHVGAKAHRCAVCRVNFVAFGRRRSEFVSSWKQKQLQQQADAQAAEAQRPEPSDASQLPSNEAEKTVV